MPRPIAWLAHPLSAQTHEGIAANLASAKRWLAWCYKTFDRIDFAAPWIPCCESMDDANPADRERGLEFDVEMVRRCDEFWMVGGRVSSGMNIEMASARLHNKKIVDLTFLGSQPPLIVSLADWCGLCGSKLASELPCSYQHTVRRQERDFLVKAGALLP